MRHLNLQEVSELHDRAIWAMGGLSGTNLKQIRLLDSALKQIQNDDYYQRFIDKLTHIMFACVKFHLFIDGNKCTPLFMDDVLVILNHKATLEVGR
ncbi:Fic family protein [Helicobacter bilis]|uniref:Fic family protein n=1 Tax=Helicobacter bilis TaxID=37372 RepID=UPI0026ED2D77|nr:Fic family protein [Helicobacter bilis]MCI7411435.1 type II toxin-antitoxin system death-on-curing family toxin [Helicobacter bilis]MDD7297473.1 type II toxin-antitoxin system death-on-curing family toxin [Helicobacter bilis]MDY4400292.1 type II toxin-antitoxin system death-on-curing family toxin [Helicobacter bilis]